jgi:hypothetical protein
MTNASNDHERELRAPAEQAGLLMDALALREDAPSQSREVSTWPAVWHFAIN